MKEFITSNLVMENSFIQKIREINEESEIYSEENTEFAKICRLSINSEDDEREYGCKIGNYITVYTDRIYTLDTDKLKKIASLLSQELLRLSLNACRKQHVDGLSVLVAGIGNKQITPDAVGPKTVDRLCITRHIKLVDPKNFHGANFCSVAAINCGVMGDTGMETLEILKGIVSQITPDIVIAVDALAARECERLASTVQISDSGIAPGAGIGNRRSAINKDSLGVPVIAIGAPTVVSAATVISDALYKCGNDKPNIKMREILNNSKNFFVAPKECDLITQSVAELLSRAIDGAFSVI